jgi:CRISPR/Cas system-associated exonuclease Cas4 (RecB family)
MPVKHLSYSSINTFMLCPRSWFYRYVEKPEVPVNAALPFGSAIHEVLQTYITAKVLHPDEVRPLHELWPDCWHDTWTEQRQEINFDKPRSYYDTLGKTMLQAPDVVRVIEAIQPRPALTPPGFDRTFYIEHKVDFTVPGVPVPIIGYIDMIAADGVPVDFKTSARKWSGGKEHNELQPNFYLAALSKTSPEIASTRKFRYIVLTKTRKPTCQVLETSRTWEQLLWTCQAIESVWRAISAGHFPPNVSGWKCSPKYCDYSHLCRWRES